MLEQIPCYQCTWAEWVELHPDTEVLIYSETPLHWDGRHGHGADEDLNTRGVGAGLGPFFVRTLAGPIDTRLPEHTAVLGVNVDAGVKAYPLWEVQRSGCVVNDRMGQEPIVIFLRAPQSHMMAAYGRRLDGQVLEFERADGRFVDRQTGSVWTIEGQAIAGLLKGKSLQPLNFIFIKWHIWALYHPSTGLYLSDAQEARGIPLGVFEPLLNKLKEAGYMVQLVNEVPQILLPQQAARGLVLKIDEDRLNLYWFDAPDAAKDYDRLEDHTRRVGSYVLQSDPETQYADVYQMERLPDDQIAWSRLLDDERFLDVVAPLRERPGESQERGLVDLFDALTEAGYAVRDADFAPLDSLPVGAVRGIRTSVQGDPFLVYKFPDEASADAFVRERRHCVRVGRIVFRSDPPDQYEFPHLGTGNRPEEEVSWSSLLTDERFVNTLQAIGGSK